MNNIELHANDLILDGKIKIEKLDEDQAEAFNKQTKEEIVKLRKAEYLKGLRIKVKQHFDAGSMSWVEFTARLNEIKELDADPTIDWATFVPDIAPIVSTPTKALLEGEPLKPLKSPKRVGLYEKSQKKNESYSESRVPIQDLFSSLPTSLTDRKPPLPSKTPRAPKALSVSNFEDNQQHLETDPNIKGEDISDEILVQNLDVQNSSQKSPTKSGLYQSHGHDEVRKLLKRL